MASKPKEGFKEKLKTLFNPSKSGSTGQEQQRGGRSSSSSSPSVVGGGNVVHRRSSSISAFISSSHLKSISPNADMHTRLRSLKELEPLVSTKLLEDGAVENLWLQIQDLVESRDLSQRRAGVEFMIALCKGQVGRMGLCRLMFFDYLKTVTSMNFEHDDQNIGGGGDENNHHEQQRQPPHLLLLYTELLSALCNGGEDVNDFEEDIAPYTTTLLYEYLRRGTTTTDATKFLNLLQNLLKHQAVYFDDESILRDTIRYVCIAMCRTKSSSSSSSIDEIVASTNVLDAVLRYCRWPNGVLLVVVTALCKLVNANKSLCEHCTAFARRLLGSTYGHGAVYTMCNLMQAAEMYPDEGVLRGAVYFVSISLWGGANQKVDSLRHTPGAVLPFILQSLASNSLGVAFEVASSVERLIQQFGPDLQLLTWDLVLKILERIFDLVASSNDKKSNKQSQSQSSASSLANLVANKSHDSLNWIESLHENHQFNGSPEQLFNLIENVAKHRPEGSILRLMDYRTKSLSPSRGNWLSQLQALLDTYYNRDTRPNIRIEAVRILRNLFDQHRHLHGDELVEVVVLTVFGEADREPDLDVQANVIQLLVDMAKSSAHNCFYELLAILERIIYGRLENIDSSPSTSSTKNRRDDNSAYLRQLFANVTVALNGLIEIAKSKWNSTPATDALHALDLLTSHLLLQYNSTSSTSCRVVFDEYGSAARRTALRFLLSLGAEIGTQKLLYKDNKDSPTTTTSGGQNGVVAAVPSAYIICVESDQDASPPRSPIFPTVPALSSTTALSSAAEIGGGKLVDFCAKNVVKAFASCMENERDWTVLRQLLDDMPTFLLNRRLAISDVDGVGTICSAAIRLVSGNNNGYGDDEISVGGTLVDRFIQQQTSSSASADKLTSDEVKERVYPLLTSLIPYRSSFDANLQRRLADTIQHGTVDPKCAFAVISTINCLFEMPDIMAPTIGQLVRRLSELPPAPTIAIPVVELLSTLMRMHRLYAQFTVEDYERVLATLTSYVDPFMLTDYIVAVAYQVIFRWFLRAPLKMRPHLARYALNRIGDIVVKKKKPNNKPIATTTASSDDTDPLLRKAYEDAREVCITFFAYYSFTDRPPSFERSPIARKLFGNNPSRHWIIGDRVFSITASGKAGGCEKCRVAIAQKTKEAQEEEQQKQKQQQQNFTDKRRRHASAVQNRVTPRVTPQLQHRSAADDTCIGDFSSSPAILRQKEERSAAAASTSTNGESSCCFCWCREWIELTVRHAFGRQAWVMRVGGAAGANQLDTVALLGGGQAEEAEEEEIIGEKESTVNNEKNNTNDDALEANFPIDRSIIPLDLRSILLQLFSANIPLDPAISPGDQRSIQSLPDTEALERAIKNLDRISHYESHKIGVIYIAARQTTEAEILQNQFGSARYESFLKGLGKLINLKEAAAVDNDPPKTYIGGLDTSSSGRDGEFTIHWSDQTSQVVFHVATKMPNRDNDPDCRQKKLHIGNDFVTIVFNESGCEYKLSTISGQFARVAIIVQPLDEKILHIKLVAKNEIASWLSMKEAAMSDELAPLLCRQMAIRADASARIWEQQKSTPSEEPVLCQTAERLRQIKSIKTRFGGKPLTVTSMFD